MFKKFFGGSKSKAVVPREKKGKGKAQREQTEVDEFAEREMMADAERNIYQFETPTQELGLTDLIKKHQAGDRFQYIALTGGETESFEARLRRMVTFKPIVQKEMIDIDNLPHLKMVKDTETLSLQEVIPKKCLEYVKVSNVIGYFSPTSSITATFSKVKISLMDGRYDPPHPVQTATIGGNMDSKVELSMDYCIPKDAASKIQLMVAREQATMARGQQWAAFQVQVMLEQTSFPYMSNKKKVVGILAPTATALEEFDVNPDAIDITMTEGDRKQLREMFQAGDIADEGEPIRTQKKAITYAKSSIRALLKGAQVEGADVVKPGWEHMVGFRKPQIPADQASIDPSDEGEEDDEPITPAMSKEEYFANQERLRRSFDVSSDTTEEIDRPNFPPKPLKPALKRFTSVDEVVEQGEKDPMQYMHPVEKPTRKGVQFGVEGV